MSAAVIPEPIAQLQLQLDQIRSTQPRGKRLPDSVWQAAVELPREHGVYSVAHHLRLDYAGLKKRRNGSAEFPIADEKDEKHASQHSSNYYEYRRRHAGKLEITRQNGSRSMESGDNKAPFMCGIAFVSSGAKDCRILVDGRRLDAVIGIEIMANNANHANSIWSK
jgi:hypothetical protein